MGFTCPTEFIAAVGAAMAFQSLIFERPLPSLRNSGWNSFTLRGVCGWFQLGPISGLTLSPFHAYCWNTTLNAHVLGWITSYLSFTFLPFTFIYLHLFLPFLYLLISFFPTFPVPSYLFLFYISCSLLPHLFLPFLYLLIFPFLYLLLSCFPFPSQWTSHSFS